MNRLILCEGKTDAILLSYYLGKICGWKFCKNAPKGAQIVADTRASEFVAWYSRGDERLLICAVGSKSRFGQFFDAKIREPLIASSKFSKIALIIDRDDEEVEVIQNTIREELPVVGSQATNGSWVQHQYINRFGEEQPVSFLLKIIPHDHQGALEALMLDAISEKPYDKNIVDKSKTFVDSIAPEASQYIGKKRLVSKAYLGVTWAIQSPQKVFDFIEEQIQQVKWETSAILAECFKELIEI